MARCLSSQSRSEARPPLRPPCRRSTPALIAARLEDHARTAAGAFAPNTERALRADSRVFSAWCAGQGRETLPAEPATVADFVDAMAEIRAPATVRRYCASIAAMHRAAGLAPPTSTQPVRLALRRMTRSEGVRQRQAEPLTGRRSTACSPRWGRASRPERSTFATRRLRRSPTTRCSVARNSCPYIYIGPRADAGRGRHHPGAQVEDRPGRGWDGQVPRARHASHGSCLPSGDRVARNRPVVSADFAMGRADSAALEAQEVPRIFRSSPRPPTLGPRAPTPVTRGWELEVGRDGGALRRAPARAARRGSWLSSRTEPEEGRARRSRALAHLRQGSRRPSCQAVGGGMRHR